MPDQVVDVDAVLSAAVAPAAAVVAPAGLAAAGACHCSLVAGSAVHSGHSTGHSTEPRPGH